MELRREFVFRRTVQRIFNFLFLLILGIALLGLVLAFAYQMLFHPEMLQAQVSSVVDAVLNFVQNVIGAGQ